MHTFPHLSVIVPCHNAASELSRCLAAFSAMAIHGAEYIVVDDGSSDDSASVALSTTPPIRLLRMGRRCGSATARNAGARAATGDILVFIDADVVVHTDTLPLISAAFANDATLGALIGSYDHQPSASGFYSQYRNLLHHFTHQSGPRQASTFWTGCGAIRRQLFWEQGGFDETPDAIDDVDLGGRVARAGIRIELRPDVQVTHQKQWTLLSTLRTDLVLRGIPWTLLILRDRRMPNALNVNRTNRLCVALIWLAALLLALAPEAGHHPAALLGPALGCLALVICLNRGFYGLLRRVRGMGFAFRGVAAHLLHFLLCGVSFLIGLIVFAAAVTLSRPVPISLSAARVRRSFAKRPSYASGD